MTNDKFAMTNDKSSFLRVLRASVVNSFREHANRIADIGSSMKRQASYSNRRGRRGVAAAELAVCLPIVVLMVIATIEACSALFLKQSLTVAAYALGIVLFTRQVNLPLNHLTESWTPATLPADWAGVRDAWNRVERALPGDHNRGNR